VFPEGCGFTTAPFVVTVTNLFHPPTPELAALEISHHRRLEYAQLRPARRTTTMKLSRKATRLAINPTLRAALRYADHGYFVLAVHGVDEDGVCRCELGRQCHKPGKHPATRGGVKDATLDTNMIRGWFGNGSTHNVAIATGSVSNLVVIDIDPRNGGKESAAKLFAISKYPPTAQVTTGGGGLHIYFANPDGGMKTSHGTAFGPGIDVQSDGAYVLAPPSRHVSGRLYVAVPGRSPVSHKLAKFPAKWLSAIEPRVVVGDSETTSTDHPIIEGRRNSELASYAGRLVNAGLQPAEVLNALKVINDSRCRPPLDNSEVESIAASISRYPSHGDEGDDAEVLMLGVLANHFSGGDHLLFGADGQFWQFDKTHWQPISEQVLSGIVLKQIQSVTRRRSNTTSLMKQTCALLKAKVAQSEDVLRFNAEPLQVINCVNGELWVKPDGQLKLKPHDPKSYLRHRIAVEYNPEARCPRYSKAVAEIFSKAEDPTSLGDFWHELMGYALQPSRKIPLILIGRGGGGNGKTKLTQTLLRMLGGDLVTAMQIQDLEKNRFVVGSLLGKYVFLDDDMQAGIRLPDGQLKRLSEEKTLTGERKYGNPFTFTARLLVVLLCNHPPSIADLSDGMRRRLTAIPFQRSFSRSEADNFLFEGIWSSEMSGILNVYLAGLQRVILRDWHFNRPPSVVKATSALIREANPVPEFIASMCKAGPSESYLMKELYEAFTNWTKESGITYTQQRLSFSRNVETCGFKVKHSNAGAKVCGLSLKTAAVTPSPWVRRSP
jgi:putative DNA primase/helicase